MTQNIGALSLRIGAFFPVHNCTVYLQWPFTSSVPQRGRAPKAKKKETMNEKKEEGRMPIMGRNENSEVTPDPVAKSAECDDVAVPATKNTFETTEMPASTPSKTQ